MTGFFKKVKGLFGAATNIVSSERVYQVIDKSMKLREYVQVLEDYLFVELTRKLRM